MKKLSEKKYYQKLSNLLRNCLHESPCDPDITDKQINAHKALDKFQEETTFVPDFVADNNMKSLIEDLKGLRKYSPGWENHRVDFGKCVLEQDIDKLIKKYSE